MTHLILLLKITIAISPIQLFILFYNKQNNYKNIIIDFKNKLPPYKKQAKILSDDEKNNNKLLTKTTKLFNVIDTSTHNISIDQNSIDEFYNKINNFNYNWVIFKKYYKDITYCLNRFNPKNEKHNNDIILLQETIKQIEKRLSFFGIIKYKCTYITNINFYKNKLKFMLYKITKNPKFIIKINK